MSQIEFLTTTSLPTNKLSDKHMDVLDRLNKAGDLIIPLDKFDHLKKWKAPKER